MSPHFAMAGRAYTPQLPGAANHIDAMNESGERRRRLLGELSGHISSLATAINNLGSASGVMVVAQLPWSDPSGHPAPRPRRGCHSARDASSNGF